LALRAGATDPGGMERRTLLVGGLCGGAAAAAGPFFRSRTQDPQHTMNLVLRRSADRGHADHGWLDSRHTFSFADYHDPAHMGFRSLRVINQDTVRAGRGFGTHPHRDMEIFSYVLAGALEHKDSMGNGRVLKPGEIQLMSAGTGVTHSEFNPNRTEDLHFLQIWIQPQQRGLAPSYTEWKPTPAQRTQSDVVVISPDGRDGSATIHQDAIVRRLLLPAGSVTQHTIAPGRGMWVQVIRGTLAIAGQALAAGDGAASEQPGSLTLVASEPVEALLFDLA
jgi:quercetin 2,3-dioxygenase